MTGYDALRQSAARVRLSRGLIAVTGEDRARLLHAMSTNHVQALQPGECCPAFFLNAQGRILADAWIVCREHSLLLDTGRSTKDKLLAHLDKYIIADDVALEDVTERISVIAVEGPAAEAFAGAFPISDVGAVGWRAYPDDPESLWESLERFPEASPDALELVGIENGHPRYGVDILETHLVQESGQMESVSFNKGCYLGQEIVERVRSRGAVHRHLRSLRIAGTALPAFPVEVLAGETKVGTATSGAYSERLGQIVALGVVRDSGAGVPMHLPDGTAVMLAERA
jgi:aminomethyltransferase